PWEQPRGVEDNRSAAARKGGGDGSKLVRVNAEAKQPGSEPQPLVALVLDELGHRVVAVPVAVDGRVAEHVWPRLVEGVIDPEAQPLTEVLQHKRRPLPEVVEVVLEDLRK